MGNRLSERLVGAGLFSYLVYLCLARSGQKENGRLASSGHLLFSMGKGNWKNAMVVDALHTLRDLKCHFRHPTSVPWSGLGTARASLAEQGSSGPARDCFGPPGGELGPRRSRYPARLQPAELLSEACPLIILTSLTPFPASPKFTNTWRSPRIYTAPLSSGEAKTKGFLPEGSTESEEGGARLGGGAGGEVAATGKSGSLLAL